MPNDAPTMESGWYAVERRGPRTDVTHYLRQSYRLATLCTDGKVSTTVGPVQALAMLARGETILCPTCHHTATASTLNNA